MLTTEDINKLIEVFKTKLETDQDLQNLEERLSTKQHDVLNKLDSIYGEVKTLRDEQSIHRQEHDDIDERLDKIEQIPSIAHQIKK